MPQLRPNAAKKRKKSFKKSNENSLRDLWNNIKHTNIHIKGVPEGEERAKGTENIFEDIIADNSPDLGKETDTQVQKAQRIPKRNPKRTTPRYTVIKMAKIVHKGRTLEATREKQRYVQRNSHKVIISLFSRNSTGQKGVA